MPIIGTDIRGIPKIAHSGAFFSFLFFSFLFFFSSSLFPFFNTEPTTFAGPWELVLSPNRFIDYIRNGGGLIFESIIFEIQIRKRTLRYYCHRVMRVNKAPRVVEIKTPEKLAVTRNRDVPISR